MKLTPHPAASPPPSPARGEGKKPADKGEGSESAGRRKSLEFAKAAKAAQETANSLAQAALLAEERHQPPKPRKLKFGHERVAWKPSPLAGEGGTRGVPGEGASPKQKKQTRVVSDSVAFARALRVNATGPEKKLWHVLRQPPFNKAKFRRQVPIGFVSYSHRLIVEVDGGQHADNAGDRRRDGWIRAQGFQVVRFWNDDVVRNIDGVMTTLLAHLDFREARE